MANTNTTNNVDLNTPLTREELTAYVDITNQEVREKIINAVKDNVDDLNRKFNEMLGAIENKFTRQNAEIAKALTLTNGYVTKMEATIKDLMEKDKSDRTVALLCVNDNINAVKSDIDSVSARVSEVNTVAKEIATVTKALSLAQADSAKDQKECLGNLNRSLYGCTKGIQDTVIYGQQLVANPRLKTDWNEAQALKWQKSVLSCCQQIANKSDLDRPEVYQYVYNKITAAGNPLFKDEALWKKIYPSSSTIYMVARSDYYREIFNTELSELYKKCFPEKFTFEAVVNNGVKYTDLIQTPAEVDSLIKSYCERNHLTRMQACTRLYKKLKTITGHDTKNGRIAYAKSIGYKNCSIGYYVAHNPELFEAFKRIAEGV